MQLYDGLAVADDTHFIQPGQIYPHQARDLRGLLEAAEALALDHVWICPGTQLSTSCSDVGADLDGWSIAASYTDPKARDHYNYVSARRLEKRHEDRIQIGLSEWHYWPWTINRPRDLLATITYLQNDLGVPVEWSPAHVGLDFLRLKHQQTWSWFQPCSIDLEEKIPNFLYANTCKEFHWLRRGELPPGKYILKIDKNSDHPAAATGVNLGEKNPEFVQPAMISAGFYDGRKPGFWLVEYHPRQSIFDGVRAPGISGFKYMTTDLVEQLKKVGYAVHVKSGWAWEHYHQVLRRPMTELWALRQAAKQDRERSTAHENAYKSYGSIMHAIPGRFADDDGRDLHFRRRDWWATIVARAISTGLYNISEIVKRLGPVVVLVDVDALLIVTDEPDPARLLPWLLNRNKLGGYKDEWVQRITPEIRDWFREPGITSKRIMTRLNERHAARIKQLDFCKGKEKYNETTN